MIDDSVFQNKKVAYHTLGCKLNFAETSHIGRQLTDEGFSKARPGEKADVCIINTCSVTDAADHKSRQAINRLRRQHPDAKIIVTGCYAQLKPEEISKIEGVDLVLGSNEKFDIPHFLKISDNSSVYREDILKTKVFRPSYSQDDRTRYFLKVQDGCDYHCTYCTIPLARGHSRSGSIAETVEMAKKIIDAGGKEIVLTGVNTGDFGKHSGETFLNLVRALDGISEGIRYRISSIEPNLITNEIIGIVAQSKCFMPHFHIPLQSGANEILSLMKRRYTVELFADKLSTIKSVMPDAFIGIDTIVGVRGETEALFEKGYEFIRSLNFSQLHVFTYSERTDTKMLEIAHIVAPEERKKRSETLHRLSDEKTKAFYQSQIGRHTRVLWEAKKDGNAMQGFSENYIRLQRPFDKDMINKIEEVTIGDWNKDNTALTIA
ncbi:MAG: tRNA (N(6)-L-threonylcarbamoyladenosine(37)-C(2))-methylthiotransferase MtaB [Paludibacteraceae bacterium]